MPWRFELPAALRTFLDWNTLPLPATSERSVPKVLAVSAFEHDLRFFSQFRGSGNWEVTVTSSVETAKFLLDEHRYSVVVCDRDIPGWEWREMFAFLMTSAPMTTFLLTSRPGDPLLLQEVLRHGGFGIVQKPLIADSVDPMLCSAWQYSKLQTVCPD